MQHTHSKLMPVEEDDDWAEGGRILSKYDDDAQIALERKKKSRITIGQNEPVRKAEDDRPQASLEIKKVTGSDYFTEQEIGLTFKKPSFAGRKRKREEDDDIVTQLEKSAVGQSFLATKRERREAVQEEDSKAKQEESQRKASNFKRAFDRVKERAKMLEREEPDALAQIEIVDDEYSLIANQLEKQR